ncbi:MAG: hypothetical protein ACI86H_002549 [bacterium]|jgi:hypothetical protein
MQKINLFFGILLIALFTYSCGNTVATPVENGDSATDPVVAVTTEKETPAPAPKTDVDPMSLLKGKLLPELLAGEMNGMTLGMDGSEPILYTMYDVDKDGDKDLFLQVLFQRGEVVQDAFVLYYNNEKPAVDPNFKAGFSADDYHLLGSDAGDPRPCTICLFEKTEENVFVFKDRANAAPLNFKLIREEDIGLTWEKQ